MDIITAIKPSPKEANRCAIRVKRRTVAVLHTEQVDELGLSVGTPWTDALAARVGAAATTEAARADAIKIIRRRAVGSAELADKLRRRNHGPAAVDAAVKRMVAKGLVNDEAYARSLLQAQLRRRSAGARLLRNKLMQKHLAGSIVDRVVAEVTQGRDPVAEARELASSKLRSAALRKLDPLARKRRLFGLLGRRGYDGDTIRRALAKLPGLSDDLPVDF